MASCFASKESVLSSNTDTHTHTYLIIYIRMNIRRRMFSDMSVCHFISSQLNSSHLIHTLTYPLLSLSQHQLCMYCSSIRIHKILCSKCNMYATKLSRQTSTSKEIPCTQHTILTTHRILNRRVKTTAKSTYLQT